MFSFSPYNPRNAYLAARAIACLSRSNDPQAIFLDFDITGPNGGTFAVNQPTRFKLKTAVLHGAASHVILVDGCRRTDTARDLVMAYALPPNDAPGFGENVVLANLAVNSAADVLASGFASGDRVALCGYSAGSAVALFLGTSLLALRSDLQVSVIMLNGLRPAIVSYRDRHQPVSCFRWHNSYDPVSALPMHSSESAIGAALTDPVTVGRCNQYTHFAPGAQVDDDGVLTRLQPGERPDIAPNPALNLIGWGTGALNHPVAAHSIDELARRLSLSVNIPVNGDGTVLLVNGALPSSGMGFQEEIPLPADLGSHTQTGFNRGHTQQDIALALIPQQMIPLLSKPTANPRKPFYRQKNGRKWYVMYLGAAMYEAKSKTAAGKEANKLNQICERLSDDDLLTEDQEGFVEAIDYETKDSSRIELEF